ncbi:hypothetical protein A2U01_0050476, partial [Trifolium medium]|nr:hypothetical protein [Trifolium medium]
YAFVAAMTGWNCSTVSVIEGEAAALFTAYSVAIYVC